MKEVREKAVRLRQVSRKIDGLPENREEERAAAITEDSELFTWFGEQAEEASRKFENYLGFKKNLFCNWFGQKAEEASRRFEKYLGFKKNP